MLNYVFQKILLVLTGFQILIFQESFQKTGKSLIKYVPIYLDQNPDKSKVAAGLACGMTHTLCKNIGTNDIVMCPDGIGNYRFGKILGDYYFKRGEVLPHRRNIQWLDIETTREALSDDLKNSTGSIALIFFTSCLAAIGRPESEVRGSIEANVTM